MIKLKDIKGKKYIILILALGFVFPLSAFQDSLDHNLFTLFEAYLEEENTAEIIRISEQENFRAAISNLSCSQKGRIHHIAGVAHYLENNELEAITEFSQALETWRNCDGVTSQTISNTLFNVGVSYQYTSTPHKGKQFIDSALAMIHEIQNYPIEDEIAKYHAAGSFFSVVKDFVRAESYLLRALQKASKFDKNEAFYIYIDYTSLLIEYKKYDKARVTIETIDSLYFINPSDINNLDKAIFYLNSAEVYYYLKDLKTAKKYTELAVGILSKDEPEYLANANEILGVIYSDEEDFERSKKHHEIAFKIRVENNDILQAHLSSIYSIENMAEIALLSGELELADSLISRAIRLNAPNTNLDNLGLPILSDKIFNNGFYLIRELKLKDKISQSRFEIDNDFKHIKNSIRIHQKIDSLYESILSFSFLDKSKLEVLNSLENTTGNAISISLQANKITGNPKFIHDAFYFSSRSKGLALMDMLDLDRTIEEDTSMSMLTFTNLKERMDQIQSDLVVSNEDPDSLMNELSITQLQISQLVNKFKPEKKKLTTHLPVQKIQETIDEKTLFIDTYMDGENLFIFYITRDNFSYHSIPSNKIIDAITEVSEALQHPKEHFAIKQSKLIYNHIFSSTNQINLASISNLIIVPSKHIEEIPFEVLINDEGEYLIEKFEISYAYSSSLFLSTKKVAKPKTDFIGFATNYSRNLKHSLSEVGVPNRKIGPLLHAESELLSCEDIFDGELFLNERASLSNFKSHARKAAIVYVSLHNIVDKLDGSQSYFLFDDRNKEFIFHAYELNHKNWLTRLLILSACNTADGVSFQNEGVNSMSRAFLSAGVENIISSRWPATETSSNILLPNTLNKIKNGVSFSKALQKSKLEYINSVSPNLKHPYYWANFILITNDLKGSKLNFNPNSDIVYYGLLAIVLISLIVFGAKKLSIAS